MTTWYKEGVLGDLNPGARRAKRKIEQYFNQHGEDLYITSKRDGNHGHGSCHPEGDAIDFKYPRRIVSIGFIKNELRDLLGKDYDVVSHKTHIHVEYDPK